MREKSNWITILFVCYDVFDELLNYYNSIYWRTKIESCLEPNICNLCLTNLNYRPWTLMNCIRFMKNPTQLHFVHVHILSLYKNTLLFWHVWRKLPAVVSQHKGLELILWLPRSAPSCIEVLWFVWKLTQVARNSTHFRARALFLTSKHIKSNVKTAQGYAKVISHYFIYLHLSYFN